MPILPAPLRAARPFKRRSASTAIGAAIGAAILLAASSAHAQAPAAPGAIISPEVLEKAVAAALSRRRINEASALVLDPNLDGTDVALLTDEELDLAPAELSGTEKPFSRQPSPE